MDEWRRTGRLEEDWRKIGGGLEKDRRRMGGVAVMAELPSSSPGEQGVEIEITKVKCFLMLSGPLKYFFSKDWSKNRYFLDFKGSISKTDSATRNFRPVSIFWCSQKKRKNFARLRRPARVGNVTLPTPSQFLRHIWALPQT